MSKLYNRFHLLCRRMFYEPNAKIFVIVNDFLSVLIIISIIIITFESVSEFSHYNKIFLNLEIIIVGIFSIEYLCRIIGSTKKISYIFSFFGIIDILSILPTYFHLVNLTPIKSIRALRILRFLRVIRLTKIAKFEHLERPSKKDTAGIIHLNLQIYFFAIFFSVVILGNLVYVFEHGNANFKNIPLSMLWVLESLLGGSISNTIPGTYPGIIIFMVARFLSLFLLGFLVHIVGNIVSHFLLGRKNERINDS